MLVSNVIYLYYFYTHAYVYKWFTYQGNYWAANDTSKSANSAIGT